MESAYWESAPLGKARWSRVENAPAYEVKLYCGDSMVYRVEKTSSTNYDFFSPNDDAGRLLFQSESRGEDGVGSGLFKSRRVDGIR